MLPLHNDLVGDWTGFIVHGKGPATQQVNVKIEGIRDDDYLYGSYTYPGTVPHELGGNFTGELYGPWLFIKLKDHGKLRFHVQIIGGNHPEMMYGAIPRPDGKTAHATITLFPSKEKPDVPGILEMWQIFAAKDL